VYCAAALCVASPALPRYSQHTGCGVVVTFLEPLALGRGRWRQPTLSNPIALQVAFMRTKSGRIIYNRRFNIASMMAQYYPESTVDFEGRISWNPEDPNILQV
jgi:hypothetical protein